MAKLVPTLREKKRYLVFESSIPPRDAYSRVVERFAALFGTVQSGEAHITFIKSSSSRVMIGVNRAYVDKVKAALALVDEQLFTIGVTGMVNKAHL